MYSKNSYKSGLFAEFLARVYLQIRGFEILERRYITGKNSNRAEIDIIAKRGNLIIFVEVKRRKSMSDAVNSVDYKQRIRLRQSAETYLIKKKWMGDARFDMICIVGCKIKWIKACI